MFSTGISVVLPIGQENRNKPLDSLPGTVVDLSTLLVLRQARRCGLPWCRSNRTPGWCLHANLREVENIYECFRPHRMLEPPEPVATKAGLMCDGRSFDRRERGTHEEVSIHHLQHTGNGPCDVSTAEPRSPFNLTVQQCDYERPTSTV